MYVVGFRALGVEGSVLIGQLAGSVEGGWAASGEERDHEIPHTKSSTHFVTYIIRPFLVFGRSVRTYFVDIRRTF